MTSAPAGLTKKRHSDLAGLGTALWVRRGLIALLAVFVAAGALNAFGQHPDEDAVVAPEAILEVKAPERVRSGLYYELRFTIRAREELRNAHLVLGRGWIDGITLNTVEPSPLGEASRDGELALELGHIPAGEQHILWIQAQVNPTTVTHRTASTELYDGDRRILALDRTLTVLP